MKGFTIIYSGLFDKDHISISIQDSDLSLSKVLNEFIHQEWSAALKTKKRLFNGKIFRVVESHMANNSLFISVADSNYKDYYVTRTAKFSAQFGSNIHINPLSVGAIIETMDKKILFGKRTLDLDISPGQYSVPGGLMDPEKDSVDDCPDPFQALYRELWEEKSIEADEITDPVCLGLVYHNAYQQSYLPFFIQLLIKSEDLQARAAHEQEFEEFIFIDSSRAALNNFIKSHHAEMSKTCIAHAQLAIDILS